MKLGLRYLLALLSMSFSISGLAQIVAEPAATEANQTVKPISPLETGVKVTFYRSSSIIGIASNYDFLINDNLIAEIPNDSYFTLRMKPGRYKFSIFIHVIAMPTIKIVNVKDKDLYFVYQGPPLLLANIFNAGASIQEKTASEMAEVLSSATSIHKDAPLDLTQRSLAFPLAQEGQQRTTEGLKLRNAYPPTFAFDLEDVDRIPIISAACKSKYAQWLRQPKPRAFFIGPTGECGYAWGTRPSQLISSTDPVERSHEACKSVKKNECWAYAIDDDVVWKE